MGALYLLCRFTYPGGRQQMSNQLLFIAGLIVTFIFGAGALIHGLVQQGALPLDQPEIPDLNPRASTGQLLKEPRNRWVVSRLAAMFFADRLPGGFNSKTGELTYSKAKIRIPKGSTTHRLHIFDSTKASRASWVSSNPFSDPACL